MTSVNTVLFINCLFQITQIIMNIVSKPWCCILTTCTLSLQSHHASTSHSEFCPTYSITMENCNYIDFIKSKYYSFFL